MVSFPPDNEHWDLRPGQDIFAQFKITYDLIMIVGNFKGHFHLFGAVYWILCMFVEKGKDF